MKDDGNSGGRKTNGLPFMQQTDIDAMATVIEEIRPTKVLEYGAGASSLYWPNRYSFIKLWVAVEHQLDWALRVTSQERVESLQVILVFDNEWTSYTQPPKGMAPFDLIIVDGVFRKRCIEEAHKYLSPGGVVLVHDASRKDFQGLETLFPHSEMLTVGNTPDEEGYMQRDGLLKLWGDA